MKLDKKIVERRTNLMAAEGVKFVTGAHVGVNVDAGEIKAANDAVIIATGTFASAPPFLFSSWSRSGLTLRCYCPS